MEIKECSSLTLAYLGDAVYELYVRTMVVKNGSSPKVDVLHRAGVKYVNAAAQAKAVKALINEGFLSEEEIALAKRVRNHRTSTKAKNADIRDYKWATALEGLIGWLSLNNQDTRAKEIMQRAVQIIDGKAPADKNLKKENAENM